MNPLTEYSKQFYESETPTEIDVQSLIERHTKGADILEGMETLQNKKAGLMDSVNKLSEFPDLCNRYVEQIDTLNMAINRLYERYLKMMGNG